MGKIVFAGAMSHVLDPDYYQRACGDEGRRKTVECMTEIARMGERFTATRPDALIVVADDHLNAFSFNAVPALCVRIGRTVQRMKQDHAEAFDAVLDHMPEEYPLHEDLANQILAKGHRRGLRPGHVLGGAGGPRLPEPGEHHARHAADPAAGADLGELASWRRSPRPKRCFDFGRHIARVVAEGPWKVGIIATGGLSHFPELSLPRVGETDTVFDRKLIHWMEAGEHEPLRNLGVDELHKTGEHEFLNWMVLLGAVTPARAQVRYFGELPRINLAAVEWSLS